MQRVHWTGPLLWPQIDHAARQVGYPWSPTEIVQRLRKANPVFEHLDPRRISEWRNSDIGHQLVWKDRVLRSVKRKHKAGGTVTRVGILVSVKIGREFTRVQRLFRYAAQSRATEFESSKRWIVQVRKYSVTKRSKVRFSPQTSSPYIRMLKNHGTEGKSHSSTGESHRVKRRNLSNT